MLVQSSVIKTTSCNYIKMVLRDFFGCTPNRELSGGFPARFYQGPEALSIHCCIYTKQFYPLQSYLLPVSLPFPLDVFISHDLPMATSLRKMTFLHQQPLILMGPSGRRGLEGTSFVNDESGKDQSQHILEI